MEFSLNLRFGSEILIGLVNGILLYSSYQLMSEYTIFVLLALLHIQLNALVPRKLYLHVGIAASFLLSLLIIQPHNFYFVPFVLLIYLTGWVVRFIPQFHYKALACLAVALFFLFQMNWVLIATVHTNRILDGTYYRLLLEKKSVQSDSSSN